MTSYHAPALIVQHPNCPRPAFAAQTPAQRDRMRRLEAQDAIHRSMRMRISPEVVQLIDSMLHFCEEFTPADVHRWLRTSAMIEFGDPLPCEEQATQEVS